MGATAGRNGPIITNGGRPFQISDDPSASMRAGRFFGLGVAEEESSNQRESLSAYKGFDDR